jgi:ABC-2 type transport system permease protein
MRSLMMRSTALTAFAAIFRNELLLNSKRVAPYFMFALCAGNALLWWGWGPAESRGMAINSESFIAGMMPVFSFMTLPFFTAVFMGDPVVRDFRAGVTPLVLSKPVGRATYLLGKFFGNFFVLVCCQAAFPLTFFVLQWFRRPNMIVQPSKALPYLEHFLIIVVVSHLALAAVHFTVGTLTRSPKIVYALAVLLYPLYIFYQTSLLRGLPPVWRSALDPLLMNFQKEVTQTPDGRWVAGELLNHLSVSYDWGEVANRAALLLFAAACLALLHARFARAERGGDGGASAASLDLSRGGDCLYNDAATPAPSDDAASPRLAPTRGDARATPGGAAHAEAVTAARAGVKAAPLPDVGTSNAGLRAGLSKLRAALATEFRLLRAERGLVVFVPLALFFSTFELAFYPVAAEPSYSAAYASSTAGTMLLFLCGLVVFYTGEAAHRDRELRVEPVLWASPAPNYALLLSKFAATLLLALALVALVGLSAALVQVVRGHAPLDPSAYLRVYLLILLPSAALLSAASLALNVLLRDKYLAYAVQIAAGVGLFYLYGQGRNHWLYNPALYRLWTYADLTGAAGDKLRLVLLHRLYSLSLACLFLALAHLFARRKSAGGLLDGRGLGGAGWSAVAALVSALAAVAAGLALV